MSRRSPPASIAARRPTWKPAPSRRRRASTRSSIASIPPRRSGWAPRSNAPSATTTSTIPFTQKEYYQLFAFFNNTAIEADRSNPKVPGSIRFVGPSMPLSGTGNQAEHDRLAAGARRPGPAAGGPAARCWSRTWRPGKRSWPRNCKDAPRKHIP